MIEILNLITWHHIKYPSNKSWSWLLKVGPIPCLENCDDPVSSVTGELFAKPTNQGWEWAPTNVFETLSLTLTTKFSLLQDSNFNAPRKLLCSRMLATCFIHVHIQARYTHRLYKFARTLLLSKRRKVGYFSSKSVHIGRDSPIRLKVTKKKNYTKDNLVPPIKYFAYFDTDFDCIINVIINYLEKFCLNQINFTISYYVISSSLCQAAHH